METTTSSKVKLVDISFAYLDRQFDENDIKTFIKYSSGEYEIHKETTEHFTTTCTCENCFKIIEYLSCKDYITIVTAFDERIDIKICKGVNVVG